MEKNLIGVIGGALIVVSFFLPWISMGGMSLSGMGLASFSGGAYALPVLGAATAGLAFTNQRGMLIGGLVTSVLALLLSAKYLMDAMDSGAAGFGLYIALVGAIVGAAGCFMAMREKQS